MKDTTSSIIKCGNALLSCALRLKELVPITLSIKILKVKKLKKINQRGGCKSGTTVLQNVTRYQGSCDNNSDGISM